MLRWRCVRGGYRVRIGVVGVVRAECVSEWTIGASGVVGVMSRGGRRCCGVRVGKLLMMLLLHHIMIPVKLLPLRVHGGWSKCHWIVGRGSPVVGLSKLNTRDKVSECKLNQKAASAKITLPVEK